MKKIKTYVIILFGFLSLLSINPTFATFSATFVNTYVPNTTSVIIDGFTKVLDGNDLAAGDFTFVLSIEPDFETSEIEFEDITATNAEDGTITFAAVEFDYCGTYTFTVSEVDDGKTDYTYDDMVATGTITVSWDQENNTLVASVEYPEDTEFNNSYQEEEEASTLSGTIQFGAFVNIFTPTPATLESTIYTVVAATPGGAERDIYIWSYTLIDEDGNETTIYNDEDGTITIEETYEEAGEYTYTIIMNDIDEDGYYEDETVMTFTVIVELDGDDLVATVSEEDDTEFNVLVDPDPVDQTFIALKKLIDMTNSGMTLYGNDYLFELYCDGELVDSAYNDEDGRIELHYTFTQAGTYTLVVTEVDEGDSHITYASPITFYIVVEEDETGQLVATLLEE